MAEAFCRVLGPEVDCVSAGSKPAESVSPHAIEVMKEIGIDISAMHPKGFRDVPGPGYDYMVAMGCTVTCPMVPGAKEIRWDVPDPYGKGIEEYRRVRDIIRSEVTGLLGQFGLLAVGQPDNHQPLA